jgi:AraC family transcriptional regulator
MNPAQKALWFIESHLADALTLDEIAGVAGISRFHMVRAFAAATGLSVMRYARVRRLTEAARAPGARRNLQLDLRSDLKPARSSSERSLGCSQAAKWPPFSSLL